MCECGGAGQACCPAGAGSACNAPLLCAGSACTCIVAAHSNIVQLTDGTLRMYASSDSAPTEAFMNQTSGAFHATLGAGGFASLSMSGGYLGAAFCGVSGGEVYCWNQAGTNNSDGELGNGDASTPGTTGATPVVTSTGTTLTGITRVFGGGESNTACAVDASGDLWCWGNGAFGLLGNGSTNDSPFAVAVMTGSGGTATQFTGVTSVSIAESHICAVTASGALYCWGANDSGQLGTGTTSTTPTLFPQPVPTLASGVVNVSTDTISAPTEANTCATTSDGSVWCWGFNGSGQLGNGLDNGMATVPAQVDSSSGAAFFSGASSVQLLNSGNSAVAEQSANGSLWWWGNEGSLAPPVSSLPIAYTEPPSPGAAAVPVTGVFILADTATAGGGFGGNPQFVDSHGLYHQNGAAVSVQPTCPSP
jgi:hypothetical protein